MSLRTCIAALLLLSCRAKNGAWEPAPPLQHARAAHAVVATADAIYVFAGTGADGAPVLPVERFDGAAWTVVSQLPGTGLNAPAAAIRRRPHLPHRRLRPRHQRPRRFASTSTPPPPTPGPPPPRCPLRAAATRRSS